MTRYSFTWIHSCDTGTC